MLFPGRVACGSVLPGAIVRLIVRIVSVAACGRRLPYVKRTHEEPMEPVVRTSRFAYSDTVMRLTVEIAREGLTIFCKLDQDAAARPAGFALRPTTLFIFGDPKVGAKLADVAPLAGLDLPLKLLVWEQSE